MMDTPEKRICSSCHQPHRTRDILFKSEQEGNRPDSVPADKGFKFLSFCDARAQELKDAYQRFIGSYHACYQHLIQYFEKAPTPRDINVDAHEKAFVRYLEQAPSIICPPGCYVPTRLTLVAG